MSDRPHITNVYERVIRLQVLNLKAIKAAYWGGRFYEARLRGTPLKLSTRRHRITFEPALPNPGNPELRRGSRRPERLNKPGYAFKTVDDRDEYTKLYDAYDALYKQYRSLERALK